MSDIAIRVEGLSKLYRIGVAQPRYHTLRDRLADTFASPFRRAWSAVNGRPSANGGRDETIWALKDVSFEVKRGEVVGVIGRNGAGKTTLLKILSRITEPTEGRAEIHGRVGSLLEVGTGFHPELTGRENLYLNGAILGMTKVEINRKFGEIVAFAEIEKFLDTPVKRYSSGMRVRLAFAVAAHLEPEILMIDEVLAVGDAAFQKKCLGKMGDVATEGRTVLFVSHNMAAVEALCGRVMLLDGGRARSSGAPAAVIGDYERLVLASTPANHDIGLRFFNERHGLGIRNINASLVPTGPRYYDLELTFDVIATERKVDIGVGFAVSTLRGTKVATVSPALTNFVLDSLEGEVTCVFRCPRVDEHLSGGDYVFSVWLAKPKTEYLIFVEHALVVTIPPRDVYGTGAYVESVAHGVVPLRTTFTAVPTSSFQQKAGRVADHDGHDAVARRSGRC